jgi:hypothetical protein
MEMGRKKQRAGKVAGSPEITAGLDYPWSSSPRRPPRYVLYCYNHESERQYIVNAYSLYAIRKIFDHLVADNEIEPSSLDPDHTMTFGEIDIKSDEMQEILDHQYTELEEAWDLPAPYPNDISNFLHGARMSKELERRDDGEPRQPREKKTPVEKKPKLDRSKFITVQSIAEDLKMDPRDARAALRKAKIDKPVGGWLGDETWAKTIRDILAKAAKEGKKK